MKCVTCGRDCEDLMPGQKFCGKCSHPGPDHVGWMPAPEAEKTADAAVAADVPVAPVSSGTYGAEISRGNPACLVFLVDHSGSMEELIAGSTGLKKKDAVADAINRLLNELVLRCGKQREVFHYFDVGIWTYGGRNDVRRLFASDLMSIADVERAAIRRDVRTKRVPDGAGGVYTEEIELAVWIEPAAHGETPTKAAFQAALEPLQRWVADHPKSFPPVVVHITDGNYSGDSPAPVVSQVMQLRTEDGNALVFNCHISREDRPEAVYPGDQTAASYKGPQRELFDMSSLLPPLMTQAAHAKGYTVEAGARGYVYNAKNVTMIDFLDIGTRSIQERMEAL